MASFAALQHGVIATIALKVAAALLRRLDARALWAFGFPAAAIALVALWHEVGPARAFARAHPEAARIIRGHKWITYEASSFTATPQNTLDFGRVRRDLAAIRRAGFTGVVTWTMRGPQAEIPRIAAEEGLAVIAGVWDPKDRGELATAIRARRWATAYTIGHRGIHDGRYTADDLAPAMRTLRFRTRRPVSTTEPLERYGVDARLRALGDWLFPDAHFTGRTESGAYAVDVARDVAFVLEGAKLIVEWDRGDPRGREVLLKMICYPYAGIDGASPEVQKDFFVRLLDQSRDTRSAFPARVSVAVSSSFDMRWKVFYPHYPWDPYTSLFDEHARPRPAVAEIVPRL